MIVLLSLAIAHANGSWVLAAVDEERPQASRPSWPSTMVSRLDVAHARRIGSGLRAGMMGVGAEHDRLALSRPCALEIGNCILCARGRCCRADKRQRKDKISHRFLPC